MATRYTIATQDRAETFTSKTLTSPVISGAGGTTAGQQGYNATDKAILIGDGAANQTIFTSAWKAFTPSYTNITLTGSTNTGAYAQVGKIVYFRTHWKYGTGSAVGSAPVLTLPVTIATYGGVTFIGQCRFLVGGVPYLGHINNAGVISAQVASGTYLSGTSITATIPGTWAANDEFEIQGFYEAA